MRGSVVASIAVAVWAMGANGVRGVSALPGWPVAEGGWLSSPAIADLDEDGFPDVINGAQALDYLGNTLPGWPADVPSVSWSSSAVGDLDADGHPDVVVGSSQWPDGAVYALDAAGNALPGWPRATTDRVFTSPALADIDADGYLDVVVASDRYVYVLDRFGDDLAGWPKEVVGNLSPSSPAVGDLDGDGSLDIVIGSQRGRVYAWDRLGNDLAGWPKRAAGVWSSPALGDVDGDGFLDVVIGGFRDRDTGLNHVYSWDRFGANLPGWPATVDGRAYSSPALGDLTGDGFLDVVIGADDNRVYAWDRDGAALVGWPVRVGGNVWSSPVLGDVDGDGFLDVTVGSHDAHVHAWDRFGSSVHGWPKATGARIQSSPALGDINADGVLDVVVAATDGRIHAWSTDAPYREDRIQWGMFRRNAERTGILWPRIPTPTPVPVRYIDHRISDATPNGDGDAVWEPGETLSIEVDMVNPTLVSHTNAVATLTHLEHSDYTTVDVPTQSMDAWPRGATETLSFAITVAADSPPHMTALRLAVSADAAGSTFATIAIPIDATYAEPFTALVGWPKTTYGRAASAPALADLDADGRLDLIVGSADGRKVHAWNRHGGNLEGWPRAVEGRVFSTPAIADLDADGFLDIVIGATDGRVYAWDGTGSALPGWPIDVGHSMTSTPAVGDLDSDGYLDVVVAAGTGGMYAWDHLGSLLPGWPWRSASYIGVSPALGDLDGDGFLDIVFGDHDAGVYALDRRAANLPGWPRLISSWFTSASLADLDEDSFLDVVIGSGDDLLHVFDRLGQELPGWPRERKSGGGWSPAVGDIDGDGHLDIVSAGGNPDWERGTYAWDRLGNLLPGWPIRDIGGVWLGDITGDGLPNVVVSWPRLRAYDAAATQVSDWPSIGSRDPNTQLALGDLNGDGDIDLIAASGHANSGQVDVWSLGAPHAAESVPWGVARHDLHRTGRYGFTPEPIAQPGVQVVATGEVSAGEPMPISLRVETRRSPIADVRVMYSVGGHEEFTSVGAVETSTGVWTAGIPDADVGVAGIRWYAEVTDEGGRTSRAHSLEYPASPPVRGQTKVTLRPTPGGRAMWNAVAPTIQPDDASLAATLDSATGGYRAGWFAWRWNAGDGRWEVPIFLGDDTPVARDEFAPGAPWFVAATGAAGADQLRTVDGVSVDISYPHEAELHPGWNLVANPFHFPVAWSDEVITVTTGGDTMTPSAAEAAGAVDNRLVLFVASTQGYEPHWSDDEPAYAMPPGAGWWLYAAEPATLVIPPVEAETSAPPVAAKRPTRRTADWSVILSVRSDAGTDEAEAAVTRRGLSRKRRLSDMKPPPAPDSVAPRIELGSSGSLTEARERVHEAEADWMMWPVRVTNADGAAMTWRLSSVPDGYETRLVDAASGASVDLRAESQLRIGGSERAYVLRVTRIGESPSTQLRQNYPNPFNPETWIPFDLDRTAEVTITIYNGAGKAIRTLDLGALSAGKYADRTRAAYWDGANDDGEPVGSGVYFYAMQAGETVVSRRMVLLK